MEERFTGATNETATANVVQTQIGQGQPVPLQLSSARDLELMSDEEFWNYVHASVRSFTATPTDQEMRAHQYLECELSSGTYLIPLSSLAEVLPPPYRFALLPAIPGWMPGITAWRGEAIAVIDLDQYLSRGTDPKNPAVTTSERTLLIAKHEHLAVGLFVRTLGLTTTQVPGEHDKAAQHVVDVPALIKNVVQQIGIVAEHG